MSAAPGEEEERGDLDQPAPHLGSSHGRSLYMRLRIGRSQVIRKGGHPWQGSSVACRTQQDHTLFLDRACTGNVDLPPEFQGKCSRLPLWRMWEGIAAQHRWSGGVDKCVMSG
jgi:hypothetical protein